MGTLYDLFNVKEDATVDEINKSYNKIIDQANSLSQNDKIVEQIRKIKIAYGILSDYEKRKQYDADLARKRAEELLSNVQVKEKTIEHTENRKNVEVNRKNDIKIAEMDEERIRQEIDKQIEQMVIQNQNLKCEKELRQDKKYRKEQKKQERKNKRIAKKEAQYQREKQIQSYGEYLEKQGYKVKYPWTWFRIKRLLISIFVIGVLMAIAWQIPFVQHLLKNLYMENFMIKAIVDMLVSIKVSLCMNNI